MIQGRSITLEFDKISPFVSVYLCGDLACERPGYVELELSNTYSTNYLEYLLLQFASDPSLDGVLGQKESFNASWVVLEESYVSYFQVCILSNMPTILNLKLGQFAGRNPL
jgi:hypothetical protein